MGTVLMETDAKWVRIKFELSSEGSDCRVSPALLLFFCTPGRQLSLCSLQFSLFSFQAPVPNGTGLVERQDLSVPKCYS